MRRMSVACGLLVWIVSCSQAPQSADPLKAKTAGREPALPAPIVQLSGDGAALGSSHGQQLAPAIRQIHRAYFQQFFRSEVGQKQAMAIVTDFEKHIAPEHLAEMRALARQCAMDERQILLANCFLDAVPMVACSTITLPAKASPDGVARFGRNLDFPAFGVADKSSVLLIFKPQGKFAFASVAWPGMIGVLSGMNEHGLTLCNMEVDRMMRPATGMPYMLLYRTILERCKTVAEAIALLENASRQTANNLMVMDAAGDRAVCEITPRKVVVRRASGAEALISTNHHRGADLNGSGRCSRFDCLRESSSARFGRIGTSDVQDMLRRVAQGNLSLQSMVFEPSNRVIYLAAGADAPTQPYGRLDLKPMFR